MKQKLKLQFSTDLSICNTWNTRIKQVSQFDRVAHKRNRRKSGVVLNVMQIQTITPGCQCKQETKSGSLTQAMHGILISIFLKYDIWPESYVLIRTIAQTICIRQTSSNFELARTGKSWKYQEISFLAHRLCKNLVHAYACCFFYVTNAV